jgi:hypothetical protein
MSLSYEYFSQRDWTCFYSDFGYITVLWTQTYSVYPADKSRVKCTNKTCNWLMWDLTYLKCCWALYRPGEQTLGPLSGGLCVTMKTSASEVYRSQERCITAPAVGWSRTQSRPWTGLPYPQGPDSYPREHTQLLGEAERRADPALGCPIRRDLTLVPTRTHPAVDTQHLRLVEFRDKFWRAFRFFRYLNIASLIAWSMLEEWLWMRNFKRCWGKR